MKIYDCFTFYNELDLLEVRLNELNEVVDYFVLVEAESSHQNKPKPLYFEKNKDKYKSFLDKIIHIVVKKEEFVDGNFWHNENIQRNAILRGITQATDEDFLIVSDLDEIPTKQSVLDGVNQNKTPAAFEQILHYFYMNTPSIENSSYINCGSVLIKKSQFEQNTEIVRSRVKSRTFFRIRDGGWHFSFLGNENNAMNKINNYAHGEFRHIDEKTIKQRLDHLVDPLGRPEHKMIVVDNLSYLPKYVTDNLKIFEKYIKRG
jgi:beta-1,4-mannosyl-glycoprotein beta-1,4-N-acetylglucosaminyltransferase